MVEKNYPKVVYWFKVTGDKEANAALFAELRNLTGKEKWNYPIPKEGDIWFNEECGLTCCQPENKIARMAMMVGIELKYNKRIALNDGYIRPMMANPSENDSIVVTDPDKDEKDSIVVETYADYFDDIIKEMSEIHKKKNADYGNNFHKRYKKWGFLTALLRLSDKMERLENIYEKGEIMVKDESVEDTLIDLANYAVMTAVELRNEKNNKKNSL